jgi:AcrR family transcriptional regulator
MYEYADRSTSSLTMVAARTRQAAVEAALQLFNSESVCSVSTSRIAAVCGISRSNLEYHFPSKKEIVREVFGLIVAEMNSGWYQDHLDPTATRMAAMYARHSLLVYRYRFFYRELPQLLRADPLLQRGYLENRQRRFAAVEQFFKKLDTFGVMCFMGDERLLRSLLESTWVLSENWLQTHCQPDGPVRAASIFQSYRMILDILRPYARAEQSTLTDDCWQAISNYVATKVP